MRWDVRNITLEVQTMGSEGLQACKHSKFHLSRPFWRQKSLLHCLPLPFSGYRHLPNLLVSRLRLTCSVCDGTLETSHWKCRQWVLRVCKLANIQIFIFYGHFGTKNHCCTVYTGISRFSIFEEV